MSKKVFKIPVIWEMSGYIKVEADTLDEAIKKFDEKEASDDDYALPEGNYVDSSFQREDEEICQIMNENV